MGSIQKIGSTLQYAVDERMMDRLPVSRIPRLRRAQTAARKGIRIGERVTLDREQNSV